MKKQVTIILSLLLFFTYSVSASAKSDDKNTVVFKVHLHCNNCEKKIKENIRFEKGVTGINTDLKEQTVSITYKTDKTDEEKLSAALEKLGYKPEGIISEQEE
ncbi:MAG: heavy-metal-associated domain-containing protein [Candidatus Azobacteroides sp.]|nr:heavy-metal-associated domain-containing protein [Candidatus Azobacteroides sp.]